MRQTLLNWARSVYDEDSMPHPQTLYRMAARGDIPGAFQDQAKRWYVESATTQSLIDDIVGDDPVLQSAVG